MKPDLEQTLLVAIDALDSLGLRYAVVGGLAVAAWALPRATRDVDLYAELPPDMREKVQHELEVRGFEVPAMEEDLKQFGVFRCRSRQDRIFLDVFNAVGPLGEAILSGRRSIEISGRKVWLASPEGLAVLKAFSDRQRDFDDLCALVRGQPEIDRGFIQEWARRLDETIGGNDVTDRVGRAFAAI